MSKKDKPFGRKSKRTQYPWLFPLIVGMVLIGLVFFVLRGRPVAQQLAAIEVHDAASLKVDQEQIDMGDVKLGRMVEASFLLTNVGDQPLRFTKPPYIEVVEGC
jgi:hypothetical protein